MNNYPNWVYKWPSLQFVLYRQKNTCNSPHMYSLLPTYLWCLLFCFCVVWQRSQFSSWTLHAWRRLWIAFNEWKIMEIEYMNDLHFSPRCTDKKIHVTPHIGMTYFPHRQKPHSHWQTTHPINYITYGLKKLSFSQRMN